MHSKTITRTCCKAKAKAKAKDLSLKAKAKAKDTKIVLKDSLRPRPRPRTNITDLFYYFRHVGRCCINQSVIFSERELCHRPSVCLSSVTFVRPTQTIEIFVNVSMPFGTLAIHDLSVKILRRSSLRWES